MIRHQWSCPCSRRRDTATTSMATSSKSGWESGTGWTWWGWQQDLGGELSLYQGADGSRAYITTQGPLPHPLLDFWRLVWEFGFKVSFGGAGGANILSPPLALFFLSPIIPLSPYLSCLRDPKGMSRNGEWAGRCSQLSRMHFLVQGEGERNLASTSLMLVLKGPVLGVTPLLLFNFFVAVFRLIHGAYPCSVHNPSTAGLPTPNLHHRPSGPILWLPWYSSDVFLPLLPSLCSSQFGLCCSSDVSGMALPQSLCLGCSLCLEHSRLLPPWDLPGSYII